MNRILLTATATVMIAASAMADTPVYELTQGDNRLEVSDLVELPRKSKNDIFVGAAIHIVDNLDSETDFLESVDFDSRKIQLARKVSFGENKTATTYKYRIAFQAADGLLSFVCYDISAGYREKGILPRTLPVEKLTPDKNPRHQELIDEYTRINSEFINNMAEAIKSGNTQPVSHWDEIKDNRVVKGMNATEVKLALGRPASIRDTNSRSKWMYGNDTVIIFTDGKVTTVIE